jgi:hypothetical protein
MKNVTMVAIALLALSGCSKKDGGGESAGAALTKMTEFKNAMCACKDAKCAQDVSDKMTKWTQSQGEGGAKAAKMSDADSKQAAAIGEEMGTCMQTAMSASATPSAAPGSAAAGSADGAGSAADSAGVPSECAEYRAQVEKLKTCNALPDTTKEPLIKAYDDASAGWATLPDGAKAGLGESCKRGTEALVAAVKDACGW